MTEQNTQFEEPQLSENQKLVGEFLSGAKALSDLPETLQNQILTGDTAEFEPKAEMPPAPAETEDPPASEEPPTEASKEPPAKRKGPKSKEELQQLALERANKINELQQERQRHEDKLKSDPTYRKEYFEKLGISEPAAVAPKPLDVWDEKTQREQSELIRQLKEERDQRVQQAELNKLYASMTDFAQTQAGHEFEAPLSELDQATKDWESIHGKAPTVQELESLGYDTSDVTMYNRMVEVQKFQMARKYPTFESAWADYSRINGISAPAASQSTVDSQDRVARRERVQQILNHPRIMTNSRAKEADIGMTTEFMRTWMATHPDTSSLNDSDQKIWANIKTRLGM